jgi:glycosyltransferase involved in cell wall biosynthesis
MESALPVRFPVSIIIPTTCELRRQDALTGAVQSVRNQARLNPEIIIVVNGNRHHHALFDSLKHEADLRVLLHKDANLPDARYLGRATVTKEYFAFLDDDDEFLPDSLWPALCTLEQHTSVDVVVSNGLRCVEGKTDPIFDSMRSFQQDPLKALLKRNWLGSSGAVFRTRSVGVEFFQNLPTCFEWTLIAFKLAMEKQVFFRDELLNRINDTPESLSKSAEYRLAIEPVLEAISSFDLPADSRRLLKIKRSKAFHDLSDFHRENGNFKKAWIYHFKSLTGLYGCRFLAYTRKLMGLFAVRQGLRSIGPGSDY